MPDLASCQCHLCIRNCPDGRIKGPGLGNHDYSERLKSKIVKYMNLPTFP